jgi:hypothetical protein
MPAIIGPVGAAEDVDVECHGYADLASLDMALRLRSGRTD